MPVWSTKENKEFIGLYEELRADDKSRKFTGQRSDDPPLSTSQASGGRLLATPSPHVYAGALCYGSTFIISRCSESLQVQDNTLPIKDISSQVFGEVFKWIVIMTACLQIIQAFVEEYFHKVYMTTKFFTESILLGCCITSVHLFTSYQIPTVHLKLVGPGNTGWSKTLSLIPGPEMRADL